MNVLRGANRALAGGPALVGRDYELVLAQELLRGPEVRVLVLRGPGGVGKTRLAREVQESLSPHFDLGAVFVNLAPLSGEDQVLPAICRALNVHESASALESLAQAVGERSLLLVLDNLEHLPHPEGDIVALCARLPGVRLLVTSRHVLRVRQVRELPLAPLALPARPEEAARSPAVQLFVQRAQEIEPEFSLTPDNTALVSGVCRALGGLPLALELAAARLRAVDLAGLLDWLDRPLEVLDGGPLDDAPRTRSLRHGLRWSYDLLTAGEQAVFTACGTFVGGFTLDALEAVTARTDVRAALITLVEHSLIQRAEGAPPRWQLLEPVREFAVEVLRDSPDAALLAERHAQWYLKLAEIADSPEQGMERDAQKRLQADDTNLISALEHFIGQAATREAQRLVAGLFDHWSRRGRFRQGVALCRRVLALPGEPGTEERAELLTRAALLASRAGLHQDAEAWCREALSLRQALGDPWKEGMALSNLASVLSNTGDFGGAVDLFQQALVLAEAQHDLLSQAHTLHNLAFNLEKVGAYSASLTHFDRALAAWRALEQPLGEAYSSGVRARVSLLHRDLTSGLTHLRHAWTLGHTFDDVVFESGLLYIAALLAERLGRRTLAVRLAAASAELERSMEGSLPGGCSAERDALVAELCAELPEAEFRSAWEAGAQAADDVRAADVDSALAAEVPAALPPEVRLTSRELEVLAGVAQGQSDKKVAQTLGISPGTVGKHVASMLGKLELHNRVELARWALERHRPP